MEMVKIKTTGNTNRFSENRPNALIFIEYTEDLDGALFWMVDNMYARQDAELYFDSVEFLETKEL